jgi:hypothetical protein
MVLIFAMLAMRDLLKQKKELKRITHNLILTLSEEVKNAKIPKRE